MENPGAIIRRPIVTEASNVRMANGEYTFEVALTATKTQIRQAIEALFKVDVERVNTARMHGKERRMGRSVGRRPDWKKAIVKLKPGQKIQVFEGL